MKDIYINKICIKCNSAFDYTENNTRWYERSTYSEKVVECPCCKSINVIKYIDAAGLYTNTDQRYFE